MLRQIGQKQAYNRYTLADNAHLHHLLALLVFFFGAAAHGKKSLTREITTPTMAMAAITINTLSMNSVPF